MYVKNEVDLYDFKNELKGDFSDDAIELIFNYLEGLYYDDELPFPVSDCRYGFGEYDLEELITDFGDTLIENEYHSLDLAELVNDNISEKEIIDFLEGEGYDKSEFDEVDTLDALGETVDELWEQFGDDLIKAGAIDITDFELDELDGYVGDNRVIVVLNNGNL